MTSIKKITIPVLRSMIQWNFAKQGKKLSNINKATKPKLLEIVEKYNIDKDEYWKEMEKEEEEEKEDEIREKIEQDKKEQEEKYLIINVEL
jgi:GTP1/Obg family GTP-binding protein